MRRHFFIAAILVLAAAPAWAAAEKPLTIAAAAIIGYDNNAHLNAERKDDAFGEETVTVDWKTDLCEAARLRLAYDLLNINYFEATDEDVLLQRAGTGLDVTLKPGTVIETDYEFQFVYFSDNEDVTYYLNRLRAGLRQDLMKGVVATGGYSVSYREFDSRKLRDPNGVLSSDDERSDRIFQPDAGLSWRIDKKTQLNGFFQYTTQDSDDRFHDFYDYDASKFAVSLKRALPWRFIGTAGFSYENRAYDSRPLVDDKNTDQSDDIYTASAGLYWKLNKTVTFGGAYSWRQKESNEPSQSYSGSIWTLGVFSAF